MKKTTARKTSAKAIGSALLASLLCVSVLVGCSKGADSADIYDTYYNAAPTEPGYGFVKEESSSSGSTYYQYSDKVTADMDMGVAENESIQLDSSKSDGQVTDGRKIIYSSYYRVQTTVFDEATAALNSLCEKYDAYYEHSECRGSAEDGSRYGSYTVRVPVDHYKAFCTEAGSIGTVVHSTENNQDVTERYFDTEARLESAKIREERLLDILRTAETLDNVLLLESELANVRYEIENLSGTLRKYDSLVSYSTVSIDINEVYRPITVQPKPKTFGERVTYALSSGIEDFVDGFQDLTVELSYNLPGFILFVIIVLVIVLLIKLAIRKRRIKKQAKQNVTEKTEI